MTTKHEAIDHIRVNLTICKAVADVLPDLTTATVRNEYTAAMGYALDIVRDKLEGVIKGGLH